MKNKNVYIAGAIIVLIVAVIFITRPSGNSSVLKNVDDQKETLSKDSLIGTKSAQATKTGQKPAAAPSITGSKTASNLPEIDFIDKRLVFPLKDFPNVKITIEKVVFGRGETVTSTGCSGIPNADFNAYLYPGNICISDTKVDGSPRGIVAFHILVENNGQMGFGGVSNTLRLHYLRADSSGTPTHIFANPLMDLGSYYINSYSSKEIVLSYLVPENQLVYDLVAGYKEPSLEKRSLNVYDFSVNGLLVDFGSKSLKIVK